MLYFFCHGGMGRCAGRAVVWVIAALVVVGGLVSALFLVQPGLSKFSGSEQAEAQAFDEAAAMAALETLQQRLAAVVQYKRDPRPLLADAQALVERYPGFAPARVSYAQVLFVNGRGALGYEQLNKALEIDPAQAQTQVLAGSTAMQLKRFEDAQRHFARAVALQPRNAKVRLMLATAQLRQNKYDDARETLLRAIKLDSSFDAAYATLSDLYKAQNKIGMALDQIERALSLTPKDQADRREIYLRKKATLLLRDNRPTDAMRAMRELAPKRLVDPQVSEELAAIWMRLQQPGRAANHYEQIVIINPAADWAAARAAHYRLEAGQVEQARQDLATLRRINPRSPAIHELEKALRE